MVFFLLITFQVAVYARPKGRHWSEDFISSVPNHELCQKPSLNPEEVLEAVRSLRWDLLYHSFRRHELYPGAPVFALDEPSERDKDARPDASLVHADSDDASSRPIGASVTCPRCMQSGLPFLVPALLPAGLLKGRSYLEVASLEGTRCFWAEEQGASDVVCTDYHGWGGFEDANTHGLGWREAANTTKADLRSKARVYGSRSLDAFKLIRCLRHSKVKGLRINVYDVDPNLLEQSVGRRAFDVVYAGGLFYHLKHPVLGFEALASVTSGVLVFETEVLKVPKGISSDWHRDGISVIPKNPNVPASSLYHEGYRDQAPQEAALCRWFREGELLQDKTNFWTCSAEAYASMLRSAGFPYVHLLGLEIYPSLRAHPWRDRRVIAAAKTRQGDLRIVRNYPTGRIRL